MVITKVGENVSVDGNLIFNTKIDTSGLSKDVKNLSSILGKSKTDFDNLSTAQGKSQKETRLTAKEHNELQGELKQSARELNDTEHEFEQMGNAAKDSGDKVSKSSKVLNGVKGVAKGAGVAMAAVGTATIAAGGAMVKASKDVAGYADDILTQSTVTGIATDKLQAYKYAAELVDVSTETLTGSMAKNIKSMKSAADGSAKYAETYAKLGVSVTDANGNLRDSETVYWEAIDALGKVSNETERDALAMQLFGKSAQDLNPLIAKGSAGMKELTAEAKNMGAVLSDEQLMKAGAYDDAMQRLKSGASAAKNAIGLVLLPQLTELTNSGTKILGDFSKAMIDADGDMGKVGEAVGIGINGIIDWITKSAPKILQAAQGIVQKVLPVAVKGIGSLLQAVISALPQFAKIILSSLPTIISSVSSIFKSIVSQLPALFKILADALPTVLPQLITAAIDCIVFLMQHINEIVQPIISKLPDIIISVVSALMSNLDKLIQGIISLVMGIVRATPQILLKLLESLPQVIEMVISGILSCLPQLIEGLITLNIELVAHLPEIIWGLICAIPKVIVAICSALLKAGSKIWEALSEIFGGAFDSLKEWAIGTYAKIMAWFQNIWSGITSIFGKIGDWCKGIFEGLRNWALGIYVKITQFFQNIWQGITSIFSNVGSWFSGIFSKAVSGIKNAFNGVKQWFSNLWQGIVSVVKTPINWIIDGINALIGGLNNVKIDVPNWVPVIGGKTFGFNINEIPHLATGTVVPANYGEFLAVLGDNKREPEIVSPVSQMKQALAEVLKERDGGANGQTVINLNVDGETWFSWLVDRNNRYKITHGASAF